MSAAVLARLLGNHQDDGARVARWISGITNLPDFPLPSDLQSDFLHIAGADVGKRDDRHLSARLRAHIFRDALHSLSGVGLNYVRKIIYQPDRRRNLNALRKEEEPSCSKHGENRRRRRKADQNRSKYLLSLDFMARIQGSASAPLWVIEVSDFQCPYCKQWHDQTYNAFLEQYVKTGKVRLAYVNFPLASHVYAWPAAESAMCAGAQGKFWPMHDGLFATQARWEATSTPMVVFDSLAHANGLDMQRWHDCVTSGKMKPLIEADHDRAARAGASATPSFMIGDKILTGAQPLPELQRVIDSALGKAKKTSP